MWVAALSIADNSPQKLFSETPAAMAPKSRVRGRALELKSLKQEMELQEIVRKKL
jgi:hypothetical protein